MFAAQAQRGMKTYLAQCASCHGSGALGSPKFGDAGAWGPRIKTGYEALLTSALKGKGAMGAQGGGTFTDFEIGRAVVHMANLPLSANVLFMTVMATKMPFVGRG